MSEPDRTKLPIRTAPFQGVANRTLHGSVPDWDLIGHVAPPAGAPNVLLVLIDDCSQDHPEPYSSHAGLADRHLRPLPVLPPGTAGSVTVHCRAMPDPAGQSPPRGERLEGWQVAPRFQRIR